MPWYLFLPTVFAVGYFFWVMFGLAFRFPLMHRVPYILSVLWLMGLLAYSAGSWLGLVY